MGGFLCECLHCSQRGGEKLPEDNRAQEVRLWIKFSFQVTLYNQISKDSWCSKAEILGFLTITLKTIRKLSHPNLTLILDCWSEIPEKRGKLKLPGTSFCIDSSFHIYNWPTVYSQSSCFTSSCYFDTTSLSGLLVLDQLLSANF